MALIFTSSYIACTYIDKRIKIIKHKFLGQREAGWMLCHMWCKPRFSIFLVQVVKNKPHFSIFLVQAVKKKKKPCFSIFLVQFVKNIFKHKHYFTSLSKQNRCEKVMIQCFPWYILEVEIDLTRTGNGTIT